MGMTLPAGEAFQSFLLEIILSFFLMTVIIHVATGSKEVGTMAAIAIGGVVALEAIFAGPVTGASMNPARSLAPALFAMNLDALWVYIAGPTTGMLIAVLIWKIYRKS